MKVELDRLTLQQIAADGLELFERACGDRLAGDGRASGAYDGWTRALESLGLWPAVNRAMNELKEARRLDATRVLDAADGGAATREMVADGLGRAA